MGLSEHRSSLRWDSAINTDCFRFWVGDGNVGNNVPLFRESDRKILDDPVNQFFNCRFDWIEGDAFKNDDGAML